MTKTATITSKRQLTIPAGIFKAAKLSERQKVLISQEGSRLVITPAADLVEKLAGSLPVPSRWRGKNIDAIIEEAKAEYFSNKDRR
jgi:bifunctional DNA-binding transcriptional regulator/antitoxin component of YhaV-PrlF toxin-antitoxin module